MRKVFALMACFAAMPAHANHPGERLDEVMAQKEPAFRAVNSISIPEPDLLGPGGARIDLQSLSDQVVVLSFLPSSCGAPCVDQQALLARVRDGVNASPMLSMVTFLVVSDVDGPLAGPLAPNVVVAGPQAPIETLIERFRALSPDAPDEPLVHVIARGNRLAAIFAGSSFRHINLILYVNGLTNEH